MTETNHDYKAAQSWLDSLRTHLRFIVGCHHYKPKETIRRALLIADKLQQEPSDKAKNLLPNLPGGSLVCEGIFKAMREQLLKEVDQEMGA